MTDKPTIRGIIASSGLSPPTQKALINWLQYRTEAGICYKQSQINALVTAAETAENEYGEMAVVSVVCNCTCEGAPKIYWDRLKDFPRMADGKGEQRGISRAANAADIDRMKRIYDRIKEGRNDEHRYQ